LAAYLDGALTGDELRRFEEIAAQDDATVREIVAQLRIHRLLEFQADGAKGEAILKEAILDAALGRGLRDASAGARRRCQEEDSEPNLILAAVVFASVVVVAICLWYYAPRP